MDTVKNVPLPHESGRLADAQPFSMYAGFKRRWLEALRSGDYGQAKGSLRRTLYHINPETKERTETTGFCCLGVACDLSGLGVWHNEWHFVINDKASTGIPNDRIMALLGVTKEDLYMDTPAGPVNKLSYLAAANDAGATFAEIADWIEANVTEVHG